MYPTRSPHASAAIPTTYKGIRFRSRLEARWAAMFDICGWRWEYEPLDLPGWIPDFLIHTKTLPLLGDGDRFWCKLSIPSVTTLWREASNRTQWKAPR